MLTERQASEILKQIGYDGLPAVTLLKRHNHVYRLDYGAATAYLKTYTKDWYGDDVPRTAYCVDHEVAAWQHLSAAGLAVPEVLLAEKSCDNPLGRPFLLTAALRGSALTALAREVEAAVFDSLLFTVGRYLSEMHRIPFDYPGYITSAGLNGPPAPGEWQHSIWTFQQFDQDARQTWLRDRQQIPPPIMRCVEDFYARYADELAREYAQPRFTHGDCHASQFFLFRQEGQWQVAGVVDMEVASAGDCKADIVKFGIEMAAVFPPSTQWWKPVFEGYGAEPAFELVKLRMLAAAHDNYSWVWPGSRAQIMQHLLDADDWQSLYDLASLTTG